MRPMLGEPVLSVVLVTVGLGVVLRSIVTIIWGVAAEIRGDRGR
jgi:branched-chain amino acid transport system permease protein